MDSQHIGHAVKQPFPVSSLFILLVVWQAPCAPISNCGHHSAACEQLEVWMLQGVGRRLFCSVLFKRTVPMAEGNSRRSEDSEDGRQLHSHMTRCGLEFAASCSCLAGVQSCSLQCRNPIMQPLVRSCDERPAGSKRICAHKLDRFIFRLWKGTGNEFTFHWT